MGTVAFVAEVLLLVDVINDFEHEDGDRLLRSFRERHAGLVSTIEAARRARVPIIYANDNRGVWDGDAPALVRRATSEGKGGELIAEVAPQTGDRFVLKPRYSAFDQTPLELLLRELAVTRIRLAGTATEMCVLQTAIAATQLGFEVVVAAEACATLDGEAERLALAYLRRVLTIEVTGPEAAAAPQFAS
jgi:nicotinamidase-related amidase